MELPVPQTLLAHPGETVHPILQTHPRDPRELLQILVQVQQALHCVPEEAVSLIADHLRVTRAHVRGLVGFYSFLSDTFLGDYVIYFSDNITDHDPPEGPGPRLAPGPFKQATQGREPVDAAREVGEVGPPDGDGANARTPPDLP